LDIEEFIVIWIAVALVLAFVIVVVRVAREPDPFKAMLEFVLVSLGIGIIMFCTGVIILMRAVSHTTNLIL
jgi:hypothetical protein